MTESILDSQLFGLTPLIFFLLMLLLQSAVPRRTRSEKWLSRMGNNALLFVFNTLLNRFLLPLSLVSIAVWAESHQLGIFNLLALPNWLAVLVCVLALDFAIYWQHVATHKFPFLWRMHKVHHADPDMDVTTAVRFHPIELLLSFVYKAACLLLLGAPILAIIIFELLLFLGAAFTHSNIRLPAWLDTALRLVIATPDAHRAHHSTWIEEQNTNYGFFIIWWDKLFGTYTVIPKDGHLEMAIGLSAADDQCDRVDQMLLAPFK